MRRFSLRYNIHCFIHVKTNIRISSICVDFVLSQVTWQIVFKFSGWTALFTCILGSTIIKKKLMQKKCNYNCFFSVRKVLTVVLSHFVTDPPYLLNAGMSGSLWVITSKTTITLLSTWPLYTYGCWQTLIPGHTGLCGSITTHCLPPIAFAMTNPIRKIRIGHTAKEKGGHGCRNVFQSLTLTIHFQKKCVSSDVGVKLKSHPWSKLGQMFHEWPSTHTHTHKQVSEPPQTVGEKMRFQFNYVFDSKPEHQHHHR